MSEQVTHYAVADDARLFALASPRVNGTFKNNLRDNHAALRLGALTRKSEVFAGALIKDLRERWQQGRSHDAEKQAFCLGTLTHRATDRLMKPIFDAQAYDGRYTYKDVSYYHDIFIFRKVYDNGNKEPFIPEQFDEMLEHPDVNIDLGVLEQLHKVFWQRRLLNTHTFKPDTDEPDIWLSNLFNVLQNDVVDLQKYYQALTNPDPELVRRATEQVNFYHDEDGILKLAHDLRRGREVSEEDFLKRSHLGDKNSLYARALAKAYGYLQIASEFWEGRLEESLFQDAITR